MKQPIRYFSIGLLTASLIILIIVYFFDKPDNHANEGSVDEMIATIKDEGYHVLSSSEYISLTVAEVPEEDNDVDVDADVTKNNETEEDSNEAQTENDPKVEDTEEPEEAHEYTLTIEPNMLGPTISQLLEDNNVIDDADEFNRYLETEGYAPYLQLGDHDVSSDMTLYEIAEVIARSR